MNASSQITTAVLLVLNRLKSCIRVSSNFSWRHCMVLMVIFLGSRNGIRLYVVISGF